LSALLQGPMAEAPQEEGRGNHGLGQQQLYGARQCAAQDIPWQPLA